MKDLRISRGTKADVIHPETPADFNTNPAMHGQKKDGMIFINGFGWVVDEGGGNLLNGSSSNFRNPGNDGVHVAVVDPKTGEVKSKDDIAELKKRLRQLPTAVSSIKTEISDEQLKLKRVSDLITAYEKIVEGNYIDNLIRAQREQYKRLDTLSLVK